MVAMVATALPVPSLRVPPELSLRRIPAAAAASPTCLVLRIGPRHFSPFVDYTFRHGRNTLTHFRIHFRIRSGVHAEFASPKFRRVFRDGFEFTGGSSRKNRSLARAGSGVGALGGNSESFNNWARAGAVEGGGLQEFLIVVLKNFEIRRKRRMQSAPWPSVIVGIALLAGILASRSAVGRVFAAGCCATLVMAVFFSILLDDGKPQIICERSQPFDVRARAQLHAFSEAIAKAVHHPHRFLASRLSSSFPTLARECEGDKVEMLTSGGSVLIPEARRISIPRSSTKNSGAHGRGEADFNSPEILIRNTDLEVTKNGPLLDMDRWADDGTSQSRDGAVPRGDVISPVPVGGRVSPSRETGSTMMTNNVPAKSPEGEENSRQPIIETGVVDERNYSGSKRAWDSPSDSEQNVYRVPEDGSRNGGVSLDSVGNNQSQPEMSPLMDALQQSKQTQTQKFEQFLDEAEALVEQGMQGLEGRIEVGVAERMLDDAANLLEKASEIYPANLIAIGQWGNSLLVHGQLKLKLSEQLRDMLLTSKPSPPSKREEGAIEDRERESMELTLQEVCEECEELLVDAGRKFRRALSLNKTDVRALYNWGLALCYRGQLISQEGGERAMEDADKVYLAAIDKFEAILGISQEHAAGALLNWGLAMLDRSRLRDMRDKERVQLLLQAKELFQDAVRVDPDYGQARGAVAVCSAELKELQGFETLQRQDTRERPNRNWWQKRG